MEERASIPWDPLHVALAFRDGALTQVWIQERAGPQTRLCAEAEEAVQRVARFLEDGRTDLAPIRVEESAISRFDREVLAELRRVRAGQTVTYGELARRLGKGPGASRAVGGAMARNPMPIVLPCHRVVQAGGALGHYSGFGGVATKLRLLQLERSRW